MFRGVRLLGVVHFFGSLYDSFDIHSHYFLQIRRPRGKTRGYDYCENHSEPPIKRRMTIKPGVGYEHMVVPKVYKVKIEQTYNYGYESKR